MTIDYLTGLAQTQTAATANAAAHRDACPAPTVTNETPADGSSANEPNVTPAATFEQPVQPATVTFTLKDTTTDTYVAGSTTMSGGNTVATFTPASSLIRGHEYTASVSGAQNGDGAPMVGTATWSFAAALYQLTAAPAVMSFNTTAGSAAFTVTNTGNVPVTIGNSFIDQDIRGGTDGSLKMTDHRCFDQHTAGALGATPLGVGESCTVDTTFTQRPPAAITDGTQSSRSAGTRTQPRPRPPTSSGQRPATSGSAT